MGLQSKGIEMPEEIHFVFRLFAPVLLGNVSSMSDEGIRCQYVFDRSEHKAAQACYRQTKPRKWWLVVFWIGLMLFIIWSNYSAASSGAPTPSDALIDPHPFLTLVENLLPLVLFIGLLSWLFVRGRHRNFQKGPFFEKSMAYALDTSSVRLRSPLIQIDLQWGAFLRAAENKKGFVLLMLGRTSFHWIPKSGLTSENDIAKMRLLLTEKIKNCRLLEPTSD